MEPLGDHAQLIRGVTYKPSDVCDVGSAASLICYRTKNVQAILDRSDLLAIPESIVKSDQKRLRPGDILVSSANSWNLVGKCCDVPDVDQAATAGAFLSILRVSSKLLDARYLYRWFSSTAVQREVRSFANQTTNISNLDHKRVARLPVPLPPLDEQQRIARILDAVNVLRAKRRESIAQLDELARSIFLEMFGEPDVSASRWGEVGMGSLVSESQLGMVRSSADFGWHFEVPYIRMDAISAEGRFLAEKVQATTATDQEKERYAVIEGDLLLNTRNSRELVGKTCVCPKSLGAVFNNNLLRLRFVEGVEPIFIQAQFGFGRVRRALEARKSGTTSVVAIYWKALRTS